MELIPLYSSEESRQLDNQTIRSGVAADKLMGFAAVAVFNTYRDIFSNYKKIFILAGSGNNGGDGLALHWLLKNENFNVSTWYKPGNHSAEFEFYMNLARMSGGKIGELPAFTENISLDNTLVIDALLGTGFQPPLKDPYALVISHVNHLKNKSRNCFILSIDTPSGFTPGHTGHLEADKLAEIGSHKIINCFTNLPRTFHPIGFDRYSFTGKSKTMLYDTSGPLPDPHRDPEGHKYKNGSSVFIGGSNGYNGAILMSQRAFHLAGGGISRVYSTEKTIDLLLKNDPSMMGTLFSELEHDNFVSKCDVAVAGPGLSEEILTGFTSRLKTGCKMIIDAGAIGLFKGHKLQDSLFTPHLGEFSGMTGKKYNHVYDAIPDLQDYCVKYNAAVLLKDSECILCKNDGSLYIYATPNERLGVMGSGDVLCGLLAAALPGTTLEEAVFLALGWLNQLAGIKTYPTLNDMLDGNKL